MASQDPRTASSTRRSPSSPPSVPRPWPRRASTPRGARRPARTRPANPADPDVGIGEAVMWAAISGTLIGVARMLASPPRRRLLRQVDRPPAPAAEEGRPGRLEGPRADLPSLPDRPEPRCEPGPRLPRARTPPWLRPLRLASRQTSVGRLDHSSLWRLRTHGHAPPRPLGRESLSDSLASAGRRLCGTRPGRADSGPRDRPQARPHRRPQGPAVDERSLVSARCAFDRRTTTGDARRRTDG